MMKTLAAASTLVLLLCGPALADSPPPAKATTGFDLELVVASGTQTRHYAMKLVDDTCGTVSSKDRGKSEDNVHVCIHGNAFEVDWSTRDDQHEIMNKSTVVARRGSSFALDGAGAKLTVTVN